MKDKVVIINYGSGNVRSLSNMLTFLGADFCLSNKKEDISRASKLIFPGQGHFAQAMENLKASGLIEIIKEKINDKTPFLGICLGLQILFEKSEEAPLVSGLGIIEGEVKKFDIKKCAKIPQIGWNKIQTTDTNSYLESGYFYFVNSYYVIPKDENIISSKTSYGVDFCSSIQKDNITAVQFHPEKSARAGIKFFKKWLE